MEISHGEKVLVISFFKSNNLGDLALSEALSNLIRDNNNEIVQYDFLETHKIINNQKKVYPAGKINKKFIDNYPLFKKKLSIVKFHVNKTLNNKKWLRLEEDIINSDFIVIGGGNMLMDTTVIWPDIFEMYINLATKHNKKVYVINVGAGPIIHNRSNRIISKALKKATYVSVRDKQSKDVLTKIDSDLNIEKSVDLVFSVKLDNLYKRVYKIDKIFKSEVTIGVCVLGEVCFSSYDDYLLYMKNLQNLIAKYSVESIKKPKFILFSTETMDYKAIESLYINLNKSNVKIRKLETIQEVIKIYNELDFLIGGRMHSLIFSQKLLVPFIGVIWQKKVEGLAEETKNRDRVYNLEEMNNKMDNIISQINNSINDKKLIEKMDVINNELYTKFSYNKMIENEKLY